MPILESLDRITDKTKAIFARFTRPRRSRNRNQATARYQEGESERRPGPRTMAGGGSEPSNSLPNPGIGTADVVHPSVANREDGRPVHSAVQGRIERAQRSPPLPSTAVPPHPATLDRSESSPVDPTQRLHDSTYTPFPPPLGTTPALHTVQHLHQNARSRSSRPPRSNTPSHGSHTPAATSSSYSTNARSAMRNETRRSSRSTGGGTKTSDIHISAIGNETHASSHMSAPASNSRIYKSLPPLPAGVSNRPRFDHSASPPILSTAGRLGELRTTSPMPRFDAKLGAREYHTPHHSLPNPSSSPPLSASPVQSKDSLEAAPSYLPYASGFCVGQVGTGNVQYVGTPTTLFACKLASCFSYVHSD